jgi:transglutaminase-like putative cysteine protease
VLYTIRHITRFQYDAPVSESLMEVRKHPATEGGQRCLSFQLSTRPRARVFSYRDYLGNTVHHFDVPSQHRQLLLMAESLVETQHRLDLPVSLAASAWKELDALVEREDYWEMLLPSHFVQETQLLQQFRKELGIERRSDPLSLLLEINRAVFEAFDYVPHATKVDSPIDHALAERKGVCQDMTHIMIALVRGLRIPARYVSGYLYHSRQNHDRSADGASHAWVECLLPDLGWVGFDPTNNLVADTRHIRTAIGRDYADVPPTKGVFKGNAQSHLTVSVRVAPHEGVQLPEPEVTDAADPVQATQLVAAELREAEQIQQQQQQQQ